MSLLITGGAGFIGSHLTERLLGEGRRVVVLDDLSTGSLENLGAVLGHPRLRFVEGSVLDANLVERLVEASDTVVHLAAAVGVRYVLDHPLETIRTNVDGARIVLDACGRFGRKTLVASTSEVYGKSSAGALCEDADSVLGPTSVSRWSYATAKKLDEFLALAHAQTHGLPVVVTRFFNIVGPRQAGRYGMVLPSLVRAALAGEPLRVFGDGRQTRNFTFVGDCVEALLLLLDCPGAEGEILNIGGPQEISIGELAERVRRLTGSSSPIVRVPYQQAYPQGGFEDMRRRVPCLCKIERLTGWSASTAIDEIILRTAQHERERAAESVLYAAAAAAPSLLGCST
ncbi:MAG: NAD-dependent epimerase/dehydratase family protein [Acidobacteria bacterium]|nr:NAD-dependent epimerase/dehydratase family protein [Acidobacteriota bacterium]